MKLLFNKDNNGQAELKATLGFLDGDFSFDNLKPDIELNTPQLIDLVSQAIYDKIETYYAATAPTVDEDIAQALKYMQLYIASMAYIDFAPNNDLTHSNAGRSFRNEDNEKLPWEWQLKNSNAAMAKRAYKALDLLFLLLDKTEWTEWTDSEAYKTANKLFLKNTNLFEAAFPINKSGQLYYRLVPFMEDFETDFIIPVITPDVATTLKAAEAPTAAQKTLLSLINKAVAYLSLGKALKAFPVEMFPNGLVYHEKIVDQSLARAEVMQFFNEEGKKYITRLEHEYGKQTETFDILKTTNGLEEGKKYVNL